MIYDQAYDLCNMQSKIEVDIINYHVFVSILAFVIEALHKYPLTWQVLVVARWLDRWVANKINGEHKFVLLSSMRQTSCLSTTASLRVLMICTLLIPKGNGWSLFVMPSHTFQCSTTNMFATLHCIPFTSFLGSKTCLIYLSAQCCLFYYRLQHTTSAALNGCLGLSFFYTE